MTTPLRLAYFESRINHLEPVRELTAEEISTNDQFVTIYKAAESKMELFRIFGLNYQAWISFLDSLFVKSRDTRNDALIADQLLFNLLAAGYGITEHFRVAFSQKFKKAEPAKLQAYTDFLKRLYAGSWGTAFLTDFRDYVQHFGLPVNLYNRHTSRTKVEITIGQDAFELLNKFPRGWALSKLKASHGNLDLIDLTQDYFIYLKRDYANYVATALYPEIIEIQRFYSSLANEATKGIAGRKMLFIAEVIEEGNQLTIRMIEPPNDPMTELGILVERKAPNN